MEDLIKNDATFELYHNTEGASLLNNRVLTTYPSEKSSFQVFLGLDGYSNFEDEKDDKKETEKDPAKTEVKLDPEKIAQGVTAGAGALSSVATTVQAFKGDGTKKPKRRKLLKEVCGAKPLLNKQKKATYNTCVAEYNAGKRGGVVNTETDSTPLPTSEEAPANPNKNKIIIGLVVVGVLAGVFIAYKKGLFGAKAVK